MSDKSSLAEGVVVRSYGGFWYVWEGSAVLECSLRGRFRYEKRHVLVGDKVLVRAEGGGKGVIEEILPRCNALTRPPIANVDQAVIVFAVREPDPSPQLLDRMLLVAEINRVRPLICFNKADLAAGGQVELLSRYQNLYRTVLTSATRGEGLDLLLGMLKGSTSVFAGPSGVGKSTILNSILPGVRLKTGELSAKLKRGRHTTRHVELIPLPGGGFVADTPGFSVLDLPAVEPAELSGYFPEMAALAGRCRFADCLHRQEPGCAVRAAVAGGSICGERYRHYLEFLEEVMAKRRY